jgi:hypothetical protein
MFCKLQPDEVYNLFALFSRASDPLVHHGRHFGRTVHAMCNVQALITNGILRTSEDADEESLSYEYALSSIIISWNCDST